MSEYAQCGSTWLGPFSYSRKLPSCHIKANGVRKTAKEEFFMMDNHLPRDMGKKLHYALRHMAISLR